MNLRISRAALDAIIAHAQESGREECCGLLLANPGSPAGHVDIVLPALNVAAERRRRFEIDPATLIDAYRAERGGGPRIAGCYHSHPGGNPTPSAEDAAQANPDNGIWLICGGPSLTVSAWRASSSGSIHHRFDPVEMIVTDGP